jgi:16S rRNA (adenine1518-N6/adenine1519-N6)-dimethyltransferase
MGHKLGQVFLKDKNILDKIIVSSEITSDDIVVEIGCGDGDLTERLAAIAKQVIVVEIDEACITSTQERVQNFENVSFIHQDVLTFDFSSVGSNFKLVANIPYYISAKIMKCLIKYRRSIEHATVMVQKEFCDKLVAAPGSKLYTSLSVYFSAFFDTEFEFNVSRNSFQPIPNVDSAVFTAVPHFRYDISEDAPLFDVVRSAFWGRRKPLKSALKKTPYLNLKKGFEDEADIREFMTLRGEVLTLDQFIMLCKKLEAYF